MLTEIISGLWMGDINDAFNDNFYKDNLISIVINCTIEQGFLNIPNLEKIRIPFTDNMETRDILLLKKNMDKILLFIHNNIEEKNIFIYCYNGKTLSPLIIGLYMIKYGNISKDMIKEILHSKNKDICIDLDFSIFEL